MRTPLHYQMSECDCGPATLGNMMMYLFSRSMIPQDVIPMIYEYTLDGYESIVPPAKYQYGTSDSAMISFAEKISGHAFDDMPDFQLDHQVLQHKEVILEKNSTMESWIRNGGVAVAKVWVREPHYVLITKVNTRKQNVYLFDPYYRNRQFHKDDILWTEDHPHAYNVCIPYAYMNQIARTYYSFGREEERLAILYRKRLQK